MPAVIRTALILLAFAVALVGCGGGGGGTVTTGRLSVRVSWPGRSRYVPPYANSLVCNLQVTQGPTYTLTINRSGDQPTVGTAAFAEDLPGGNHTLEVLAFSQANGQGEKVASATLTVSVTAGRTTGTDVSADLQSTIDQVVIDGQPLSVQAPNTLQVNGHAEDATQHVLLLPAGALTWDVVAGGQYGSINSTGLFTPAGVGTATVRLRETGAQRSAQADIAVGSGGATGTLTVSVDWPGRSRYVPPYANSLVCILTIAPGQNSTITINRSGTTASTGSGSFPQNLSGGSYPLALTAMSQINGQGQAVASASLTVSIPSGQSVTRNVSADLQSTIDHLVIEGQPLTVAIPNALTIAGHAETSTNTVLLLPQGSLTWDVPSGGAYGTINPVTGVFSPTAPGTATVRLREVGASKAAQANVVVTGSALPTTIYVADYGNHRIAKMDDLAGTNWLTFDPGTPVVSSLAFDSQGRIYWVDDINNCVCRASAFGGTVVKYGTTGSASGQFDGPTAVALDSQDRIYVVDKYNNRVVRLNDMSGTGWTEVGGFGSGDGQLFVPGGICVTSNGDVYVADTGNSRLVMFNGMTATGWTVYGGTRGSGVGEFDEPVSVFSAANGIYVADSANCRIVAISNMSGSGWTSFGTLGTGAGQFDTPSSVFVDAGGRIYVADTNNTRIARINDMTGTGWIAFGTTGTGANQFDSPKAIAVR